jgi:hypothetical protein
MLQGYTLANTKPNASYYKYVKELIQDSIVSNSAYILLAKYKKQQDIELILNYFYEPYGRNQILRALKYFPDSSFREILEKTVKECIKLSNDGFNTHINYNSLCAAIIHQDAYWGKNLCSLALDSLKGSELHDFRRAIFSALTIYPKMWWGGFYKYISKEVDFENMAEYLFNLRIQLELGYDPGF